ncbi:MAG TPA: HEAT repeat domain-containing protein [Candidatus Aquilonibacter sp.]|nr:HEAT repeat domain-containing protein [Candidatus Aquilonibacter sp.]
MNSWQPEFPENAPADPRLRPTPDYGNLGPGSDAAQNYGLSQKTTVAARPNSAAGLRKKARLLHFAAILAGAGLAIASSAMGPSSQLWRKLGDLLATHGTSESSAATASERDLDRQKPQKQAEVLLERAVSRSQGANEEIAQRVDHWRGRLRWDSQLGALTTAALNSSDMKVRASGVEVQLAAYGLAKNELSLERLIEQADSPDHATKIWALWAIGLMGNRSVDAQRAVDVLAAHLKDSDEDSRRWAVEGLALVGADSTLPPLLQTMHDDPSPLVRERAACSVAQSGMFTHEQRLTAIPQLLSYTDDPSLDAQTQAWAFQALGDITGQHLPNDAAAWRSWYERSAK